MLLFGHRVPAVVIGAIFTVMSTAVAAQGGQDQGVVSGPEESDLEEQAAAPAQSDPGEARPSVQKELRVVMSHKKRAVWTLAGVSGAAVITGGIFGLTALDEKQRYEDSPDQDAAQDFEDRKNARAIASYVSFGVAGAAAAAALIVWLFVDDKCDPNDDRASLTTNGTSLTIKF